MRFWRILLFAVIALSVLLLAFAAWLLGTQGGAQFALSALDRLSAGTVQAEGVRGRLAGPIVIDRFRFSGGQENITLDNIRIDWRPAALLRSRVHVTSLRIGQMRIVHQASQQKKPASMPEDIALPLALQIDKAQVDSSRISWGGADIAALDALAFRFDFDRIRYRLELAQLTAHAAMEAQTGADAKPPSLVSDFKGYATLDVAKPYALSADFTSTGEAVLQDHTVGIKGRVDAQGSLAELKASVDLLLNNSTVQGQAVLRPFAENALGKATLTTQALDISAWYPTLPQTELDASISIDDGVGRLSLLNKNAGLYSDGKLPLTALDAMFQQKADQLRVEQIMAKLGTRKQPAGAVSGSGQYGQGVLDLMLNVKALNLHRLDQRLQTTQLVGDVGIRTLADKQELTVELIEPFGKKNIALSAHASVANERITVDRAMLTLGKGSLKASGHIDLSGQNAFRAEGRMNQFRLQDLGQFETLPHVTVNGNFSLHGARRPNLVADLSFNLNDSQLAGQALQGEGQAMLRTDRLLIPKLLLAVGANRLQAQGELSEGGGKLSFKVDAPNLAQLGADFGGAMQAEGSAHGSLKEPHIDVAWKADKLRAPGQFRLQQAQGKAALVLDRNGEHSGVMLIKTLVMDVTAKELKTSAQKVAALTAHLQFSPQPKGPLMLSIQADGVAAQQWQADHVSILTRGTTAQHVMDVTLRDAAQNWAIKASGGLQGWQEQEQAVRWQGQLDRIDGEGHVTGHLASAAPLSISPQRIRLEQLIFDGNAGRIVIEQFVRDQQRIATRGRFERLELDALLQFTDRQPLMTTDLKLAGEWDVSLADVVSGKIAVRRQSGDIVIKGSAEVPLGLRALAADVRATGGKLQLQLNADGQKLGHIDMRAAASLARGDNRFTIEPAAPLTGAATLDTPSLTWLGPLLAPTLITDGKLQSTVAISGTYAHPLLAGKINGRELRLFLAGQGLDFRQGTLEAEFQNDALMVKQLHFQNEDGHLAISGPIRWRDGATTAQLALKVDRFTLLNRVDRRFVVSGQSEIDWRGRSVSGMAGERAVDSTKSKLRIVGAFNINSGFYDLGSAATPKLSDDVVIVGRSQSTGNNMALDLNVKIALGDGITLKGRGLDATLKGQMHVVSGSKNGLRAQGILEVAKGTYSAYGRKLAIEKGELRFNGPVDNPALNILAMQRGQEVEAGVTVRGTVLAPRITLVSEPSVPDAEKLSWLVLGRGLDTVASADMGTLQAAAGALLGGSSEGGLKSQLASTFGLDEIELKSDQNNTEQRIVTLGKRLSSRLYVSFEQSIQAAGSVLHLSYTLSKRLSLEAEAGTRSAVSVFYNILFD